jgi:DNA (cytosine-5)-methyltransferase 1
VNFLSFLEDELRLQKPDSAAPVVVDLFAGCGGLALGFEAAGFKTIGYEMDEDACGTYSTNLHGVCHKTFLTPTSELANRADVIIGGPPCQPFSVGGLQEGMHDKRNGFPAFIGAIERYLPRVVIFENVRGMLYKNRAYLNVILDQLAAIGYRVECSVLNAVSFGVPQKRERLIVVGHLGTWEWPRVRNQIFTAGDALGDIAHTIPEGSRFLTESMDRYVAKYEKASKCVRPRDLHLEEPSRTVTCRNLNGATGDMLRILLPDGRRRRLSVREAARLQGFPDWYQFCGSESSQFNQIGNAVPPLLGKAIATQVWKHLESTEVRNVQSGRGYRRDEQIQLQYN